ncbi:sigma-54 interaction domain-containing protein [Fuchsiella alkaliacetigena]|uniref:sigma-54 interaction domain-containing protein n=1 Tax=Fuchsiella alkaliacetigena TaxID=957042 RepID=UPI00200A66A3|nr:sigma 54-interacting transcriptional regulator [Fuchsiella alkaliacetigena]MCK8825352.1 sigma 54-interacting transcriptional regulator [Fuchsiella alkaliacetigena]
MSKLKGIGSFIQQVADAFAAVLDYEIGIVDQDLEFIAGTGTYRWPEEQDKDYNRVSGYISKHLILNQISESISVEDKKDNELCLKCIKKDICSIRAFIVHPIIYEEEVHGTFCLIAHGEEQQRHFVDYKSELMIFSKNIVRFIATTLKEKSTRKQIGIMADQFKAVINSVREGIIALDAEGKITHINESAKEILMISEPREGEHINTIFSKLDLKEVFVEINLEQNPNNYFEKRIDYEYLGSKFELLCNITLIKDEAEITGATISFRRLDELKKLATKIMATDKGSAFADIKGTSRKIIEIKEQMNRVAVTDSTVLIRGETGTGKGLFAEAIHRESNRSDKPFVAVNCAAIPESLLESELFGYEEGAFTGAKKGGKKGKFELANRGTLFLDEIGDMPLSFQVKLLRVIENKKVERVGGLSPIDFDVRIIAATNRNLEQMIEEEKFREDLFYRLNVIPFHIPPLKERREDITLLLYFFLKKHTNLLKKNIKGFSDGAKRELINYSWPGNVRELENTVEYSVNIETSNYITRNSLPDRILKQQFCAEDSTEILTVNELEKREIIKALKKFGADGQGKERAAQALGMSKTTLYRRLNKYNISIS